MRCVAVVPARRAEGTVAAAVLSLLHGNGAFVDRVIVVTAAGDPTARVVDRLAASNERVTLLAAPADRSAGAARNAGRSATDAGLLLFLDADCRLEDGGAARLAAALEAAGAAAVTARVLGEGGLVARVRHMLEFKEAASLRLPPSRWLPPSTAMLCRAEAFDRVGGFPDLWPGEDLVFAQALRDLGLRVERCNDVAVTHRHPAGVAEMLAHQHRLGFTAAVARCTRTMPGSGFARRPWLATLLLPARAVRLAAWQAREGGAAAAWALVLSPLLAAGLVAWTAGFVKAAAREARRPAVGTVGV